MSTHVDESVPSGPSESSGPSGSSEEAVDPGGPPADTGSEWVRAEMLRRMAANRSTRGRHARRGEPPAPPAAEQAPRGVFPNGVRPARRRTDSPPPWAAPAPAASAADMPENYVPRHSVQTPGPAADPVEPGSGPILVVRPAGATGDGARDAGEPGGGAGPIGGPSLPPTGLPMRRRRGGGPGTPLQADAAPVAEPWLRPGPVVPHEPARRLGAPPDMLGAAEPIPAWGLPLASPPRGFAMPALPETAAGSAPDTAPGTAAAEPVAPVLDLEVARAGGGVAPVADAPAADAVVDDTAPEDVAPEDVAPEDVAPEDVAPEDVAPEDVALDDLASDDVAPDEVVDVGAPADETATEDAPAGAEDVERDAADGAVAVGPEGDADPTPDAGPAGGPTPADAPVPTGPAASGGGPTGTAAPITGAGPRGPQRSNGASPRNASPKNGSHPADEAGPANGGVRVHAPVPAVARSAGANDVAAHPSGSVEVRVLPTATAPAAAPGPAAPAALPGETPEETTDEIAGGISDMPTAPHPIVRARRAALSGRAAEVPAQRTMDTARALTPRPMAPRNIPVVGTAPPEPGSTRVRVVLSERKGVARPVRTIKEVQEGTAVGELLRRDLIRSQLVVTTRFALLTFLVLGALPAVFALLPEVSRFHVLGLRLPWLLLGVLMYPFLVAVAWRYTRVADRVEQNFADHVQD